ncbi:MAG: ABC transporter ATP-binding protein [Flavobacteriales bacterium]|nr:ABC transporter ATP-binding protein [Flavobacteriales bacterium]
MARGRRADRIEEAPRTNVDRAAIKRSLRLLRYLRPNAGTFTLGMVFLVSTSLLSLAFPLLLGRLVDAEPKTTFLEAPFMDMGNIDSVAKLLLLVFALQALFGYGRIYTFGLVTENALARLRTDTYAHLLKQPMAYFAQHRVGELNSRISADVAILQDTLTTVLAEFIRQFLVIGIGLFLLVRVSGTLTVTMLFSLPVVALIAVLFGRYIRGLSREVQDKIADTNVVVEETLQGIQNVKSFANEAWEIGRYAWGVKEARALAIKSARWRGAFVSFIIFCMFGVVVFIVWKAVHLRASGELAVGDIMSFVGLSIMIGASIGGVPELITTLLKAVGATERLLDIQNAVPEPLDKGDPSVVTRVSGAIRFDHVGMYYPSRPDVEVLRDVSFSIRPGERVALVGPSGSGKSTIASLVLRFYIPQRGSILVDDRPVQEIPLSAWRGQVGLVPQEVLLFGGTIRENIAYGRPGADMAAVESAAKKANAHEFIMSFPEGYDTVVGERGVQLSGGQRQRVAIARALLKDPAILILDEATSALDTASEQVVQNALDRLMEGRTSLVIAHRLSTVRNADRILVLDRGIILENGTHEELIANKEGLYHALTRSELMQT